jgi:outer membrane protein insertion porin family
MSYKRQVKTSLFSAAVALPALLTILSVSCVAPKKNQYPPYKPFVFRTNIKVEGDIRSAEKQDLISKLENQLDDSLKVRTVTSIRSQLFFIYKKLVNPPVFDSSNVGRSIVFMNALLRSAGYYAPVIRDSVKIDTIKHDQYRVTINFRVIPGKNLILDSVGFDMRTPEFQQLTLQTKDQSFLKKDQAYTKQLLSKEIDRLVELFRNNGYYRFSREDLIIEHDTVIAALIDPNLDPFQQERLLEQLKRRKENPTISVVLKERPYIDSSHLIKYYIGQVTVYPDLPPVEDTAASIKNDTTVIKNITLITRSNKFKLPFIVNNIYLLPSSMYKLENYYQTFNRFNRLPAWQLTNIDFNEAELSDSLLDVTMRLYPAKKQNISYGLEASYNTNDIITASNLFGVAVNLGLHNRNAYKQSVQTNTNLRGGVELGADFIQTTQASISHSIIFPNLISPIRINKEGWLKNVQTILNFNASYTDRRQLFTVRTINGSWGYQWTKVKPLANSNRTYLYKPINIEYTTLTATDSFRRILKAIPSLNLAFKTGLVVGQQFYFASIKQIKNKTNTFRFGLEESGALLGLITSLDKGDLLRFVKGDIEYIHTINIKKTQLAMRAFAGAGYAYGRAGNGYEETLPFYKAYYAGGPNSMRGWQVRQLGLGSSKLYDIPAFIGVDRFGDVKLEGNAEFRFPLTVIFGYKINSAVFTDVGNIWNRKLIDPVQNPAEVGSDFKVDRFYKELAVDMGTGLRIDFSYFVIRLDWAYKIKDPQNLLYSDKWFHGLSLAGGQFQLGIGYPF